MPTEQPPPTTRGRITGSRIVALYNEHDTLTASERKEIERTRALIARELRAPMPEELGIASEQQGLGISLPDATVVPLQTVNRIAKNRPRIFRPTKGVSPRRLLRASRIEQVMNALMTQLFPWPLAVDLVTNEAQCAVIVQPEPSFWELRPRRYELDKDGKQTETVKREYRVDAADRSESDGYYRGTRGEGRGARKFEVDEPRSSAAYQEDLREYQAEHPPFLVRAFSRRECVPINPRQIGQRWEVDGLIVRQQYTATDLAQKLIWSGADRLLVEDPTGAVTVYEAWLTDPDGSPYVAYHVEGATDTQRKTADGEVKPSIIDFKAEYGICRLPVAFRYGLSFAGAALGKRGIPLMSPFESALLLEDSMASSKAVHASNYAFGGWFQTLDPASPPDAHLDASGNPMAVDVRPNSVTLLPAGTIIPAVHPGTNHDVQDLIVLTRGVVDRRAPDQPSEGSGYAQLIARSGVSESLDQIFDALRELYELSASFLLEQVCAFGDTYEPVVVALDEDRSAFGEAGEAELIEVEPSLAAGNYRVLAKWPPDENLPLRQQEAEFVERKLMTRREFHERRGIEDPEQYEAELMVEEMLRDPERGMPEVWEIAAEIVKDERLKKMIEMSKAQQIDQQGNPLAAIQAGLVGPQGMPAPGGMPPGLPPHMTGIGGPGAAQSALAGIIGGGMQAGAMGNAMQAGVQNPSVPPAGGG